MGVNLLNTFKQLSIYILKKKRLLKNQMEQIIWDCGTNIQLLVDIGAITRF